MRIIFAFAFIICFSIPAFAADKAATPPPDDTGVPAYAGSDTSPADDSDVPAVASPDATKEVIVPLRDKQLKADRDAAIDLVQNPPSAAGAGIAGGGSADTCSSRDVAATLKLPVMPQVGRAAAVACNEAYVKLGTACQETMLCAACDKALKDYSDACSYVKTSTPADRLQHLAAPRRNTPPVTSIPY